MKADQIIKNAKIYTSDKDRPLASALAVKDGRFVYVGDEAGLSAYEGSVTDLGGGFIMPGVFASGDVVTGAKTVVAAVAFSKKIAEDMDRYMQAHRD